jgi:hypothetical protein
VAYKGRHRLPAGSCASLRDLPLFIFHSEVSDRGSAIGRAAPLSFASFLCHAGSLGLTKRLSRSREIAWTTGRHTVFDRGTHAQADDYPPDGRRRRSIPPRGLSSRNRNSNRADDDQKQNADLKRHR